MRKETVNWADVERGRGVQNVDAAGGAGNDEGEGPLKAQLPSAGIYKTLTATSLRLSSQVPAATRLFPSPPGSGEERPPGIPTSLPCLLCETEFPESVYAA